MSASGVDLDAIITGPVQPPTGEEAVRTAERVIWHARSLADAEMLMEMLGLDVPPALMTCPRCGHAMGSVGHLRKCEPVALGERIMRIADSVGRPA